MITLTKMILIILSVHQIVYSTYKSSILHQEVKFMGYLQQPAFTWCVRMRMEVYKSWRLSIARQMVMLY